MTNETTKRITKRTHFNNLLKISEVAKDPELVGFIEKELALLDKKNASEKKPTANQLANSTIKAAVLETMEDDTHYTITELLKLVPNLPEGMTNQRMSALVRQLKDENLVIRIEEKGKAYFKKA